MTMILCDTNILIEFYKNSPSIIQELQHIGRDHLEISAITQAELYFGAINKTELRKIKRHLNLLHQISINTEITSTFLQLMESYSLSHKLSIPDALIASTALVQNSKLFTLNVKDFRFIPEIQMYQPVTFN